MRRINREITQTDDIVKTIEASDVCRLGLYADGEVYIVPMNFGYETDDAGALTLYFHCANEGRKLDMIAKNPEVCFEMDTGHMFVPGKGENACGATMNFESIIGYGTIEVSTDEKERIRALTQIMKHYTAGESFTFDEKVLLKTTVLKLRVRTCTGKRLP